MPSLACVMYQTYLRPAACLLCRLLAEFCIIATCTYYGAGLGDTAKEPLVRPPGVAVGDCKNYIYLCGDNSIQMGLVSSMVLWPVVYLALLSLLLRSAFVRLRREPYSDFKMSNLIVRLQVKHTLPRWPTTTPAWACPVRRVPSS